MVNITSVTPKAFEDGSLQVTLDLPEGTEGDYILTVTPSDSDTPVYVSCIVGLNL